MITLLLVGCAVWKPSLGMSVAEFDSMCFKSGVSYQSQVVQAQDNYEIRVCGGVTNFYYFVNGKLVRIDQGQLPKQRYQIEVK